MRKPHKYQAHHNQAGVLKQKELGIALSFAVSQGANGGIHYQNTNE